MEIPEEDDQLSKRACGARRVSFLCSNYKAVFIGANSTVANYRADLTRASSRSPPRTSSETREQLVEHLGERGCCCVLAVWMLAPAGTRLPPHPTPTRSTQPRSSLLLSRVVLRSARTSRVEPRQTKCFTERKLLSEALRFLSMAPFFFFQFFFKLLVLLFTLALRHRWTRPLLSLILKLFFKAHFNKQSGSF